MSSPLSSFEQIVCVDKTGLTPSGLDELQSFSKAKIVCHSDCRTRSDTAHPCEAREQAFAG
jgi:hypothetical protein